MRNERNAENDNEADSKGHTGGTVVSTCKMCETPYTQPRCRAKRDKFCSRQCGDLFKEVRAKRLNTKCPKCGTTFKARASQLKNGNKPYCSISCNAKSQKRTKERYDKCRATLAKNKGNHKYRAGKDHPSWKEGRARCNGYIMVFIGIVNGKRKSVPEHRLIMEDFIGRKLNESEIVHHINEVKDDNRIINLQIMTRSEHAEHHMSSRKKDKD